MLTPMLNSPSKSAHHLKNIDSHLYVRYCKLYAESEPCTYEFALKRALSMLFADEVLDYRSCYKHARHPII